VITRNKTVFVASTPLEIHETLARAVEEVTFRIFFTHHSSNLRFIVEGASFVLNITPRIVSSVPIPTFFLSSQIGALHIEMFG
jgi:hypothetical protein